MVAITEPGVYEMSAEAYHADPCPTWSLSRTGIIDLMAEPFGGCPARHYWKRHAPPVEKRTFDIGHAAHRLILGKGADIVQIDAPDYRTDMAKAARDKAHEEGKTPLLRDDYAKVEAMAEALRKHEVANAAFVNGEAEQTIIWRDQEFDVWCRCRPDWTPNGGRIVPDLKTAYSCAKDVLQRKMIDEGLFVQAALTIEGLQAVGRIERPLFIFVFQEKEPPYLCRFVQPSEGDLNWGRMVIAKAKETFARCLADNDWPGYADEIEPIGMPYWANVRLSEAQEMGAFELSHEFNRPREAAE